MFSNFFSRDININRNLTLNQSRIEEITMPEEVPTTFQMDEGFGGGMMGFGKEVDQFSTGDLQNMFYKDDNRSECFLLLFRYFALRIYIYFVVFKK